MREMETRYGGLVKAMIARGFEKRRAGAPKKKGGPAGPAGRLTSLQTGLDLLIQRLEQELAPVIR